MLHARIDPRRPLVLDTRELGRRPGSMRALRRTVPAPADLGVELAGIPAGSPLVLDLRMEAVVEGVLVSGTVTGQLRGECARCLGPVLSSESVEIQELFAYPDSTTDSTAGEDEVGRLFGDLIDLEPLIRDAVVLGLPLSPLCRSDCPGLCPGCGTRRDELPVDHDHAMIDPRWAALSERFGATGSDSQEK